MGVATVMSAGRKKGRGDRVAATVLGEGHPLMIRGDVERQQGWPRPPQGGPRWRTTSVGCCWSCSKGVGSGVYLVT